MTQTSEHPPATAERHAIVLSGGGADGAYEIGVLKALLEGKSPTTLYRPIEPAIFTGTSIGSFNAAFMVSQWDKYGAAAVGNLERVWLEKMAANLCGNGGYRIRLNPVELLNPLCWLPNPLPRLREAWEDAIYLSSDVGERLAHLLTSAAPLSQRFLDLFNLSSFVSPNPWLELIRDNVDFAAIRHTEVALRIAATDWARGRVKVFENGDMTDQRGADVIRASSSIPGFYPTARVGSQPFVDGAVLLNTPLKPAIAAGATVIHVIFLNPKIENIPIDRLESTLETFYRTQLIAWAATVNQDIQHAAAVNTTLDLSQRHAEGVLESTTAAHVLHAAGRLGHRAKTGKPVHPITIHSYAPEDLLGDAIGLLDLRRERLEELIRRGFDDTVHHPPERSTFSTEVERKARLAVQR